MSVKSLFVVNPTTLTDIRDEGKNVIVRQVVKGFAIKHLYFFRSPHVSTRNAVTVPAAFTTSRACLGDGLLRFPLPAP